MVTKKTTQPKRQKIIVISYPNYQHRITEKYLRLFLSPLGHERLWVYEKVGGRPTRKGPKRISAESHLFDLNVLGHEQEIEQYFSKIERGAIPAIRQTIAGNAISQTEITNILSLVASFMVRGVRLDDHVIQECLDWCRNNPSGRKSILGDYIPIDGLGSLVIPPSAVDRSYIPSDLVNRNRMFFFTYYIGALFKLHWHVVRCCATAPDLVTSNNPVEQTNDGNPSPTGDNPSIPNSTDMVKPGSLVTFPLSCRCALIGMYPSTTNPHAQELSNHDVHVINMRTAHYASQVYSTDNNFTPPANWGESQREPAT
jgi:Protein of unknown function (DUF4238)